MSAMPDFTADDLKMCNDTQLHCLLAALQVPANYAQGCKQFKDLDA